MQDLTQMPLSMNGLEISKGALIDHNNPVALLSRRLPNFELLEKYCQPRGIQRTDKLRNRYVLSVVV